MFVWEQDPAPNQKGESEFGATKLRNNPPLETHKIPRTDWPRAQFTSGSAVSIRMRTLASFTAAPAPWPLCLYLNKTCFHSHSNLSLGSFLHKSRAWRSPDTQEVLPGWCWGRTSPWWNQFCDNTARLIYLRLLSVLDYFSSFQSYWLNIWIFRALTFFQKSKIYRKYTLF